MIMILQPGNLYSALARWQMEASKRSQLLDF